MAFQPPPTWALPILIDEGTKQAIFNPIWLKWFVDLTSVISSVGTGGTAVNHNTLTGLQGGGSSEYYHFTNATYTNIVGGTPTFTTVKVSAVAGYKSSDGSAGFTGTVTTASLVGKTITIKDGIITNVA